MKDAIGEDEAAFFLLAINFHLQTLREVVGNAVPYFGIIAGIAILKVVCTLVDKHLLQGGQLHENGRWPLYISRFIHIQPIDADDTAVLFLLRTIDMEKRLYIEVGHTAIAVAVCLEHIGYRSTLFIQ